MTPGEALQFINRYVVIETDAPDQPGGRASAAGYLTAIDKFPNGDHWCVLDWGFAILLDASTTIVESTPQAEGDPTP